MTTQEINRAIRSYLAEHGAMSGRDICDDLGLTEDDVSWAELDGQIRRAVPAPGGVAPWYCI